MSSSAPRDAFKAYDIRGDARHVLTEDFAAALGQAAGSHVGAQKALIGYDARLSSPRLASALARGLKGTGAQVFSLGMCGTEELYFAAANGQFDLSIMVTGSHNPAHENGFKLMRGRAIPISSDTGLKAIAEATLGRLARPAPPLPSADVEDAGHWRRAHQRWLRQFSSLEGIEPKQGMKVVVDAGNGCAGLLLEGLIPHLPFEVIPRNIRPDGAFPHGVPNPLLPERREACAQAVRHNGAHLGVAFDGDFDRCFFFDAEGHMAEACYLIGPMATHLLRSRPGAAVVHDARVYWGIRDQVLAAGGRPVMGKGGHSFMKETMRRESAVFGGEMSAHYFFGDFAYCDGGMLTFCVLAALLARTGLTLGDLIADGARRYPVSGEINFRVADAAGIRQRLLDIYAPEATHVDQLDGINVELPQWRFNVRSSHTEPLLRLNVESRGDSHLVGDKVAELTELIESADQEIRESHQARKF